MTGWVLGRVSGPFLVYACAGLALMLSLSVAGNWLLVKLRDGAIKREASAQAAGDQARATAAACSKATEEAARQETERTQAARAAVQAAEARARSAAKRANDLLSLRPAVPADLCSSADVLLTDWIKRRRP